MNDFYKDALTILVFIMGLFGIFNGWQLLKSVDKTGNAPMAMCN